MNIKKLCRYLHNGYPTDIGTGRILSESTESYNPTLSAFLTLVIYTSVKKNTK